MPGLDSFHIIMNHNVPGGFLYLQIRGENVEQNPKYSVLKQNFVFCILNLEFASHFVVIIWSLPRVGLFCNSMNCSLPGSCVQGISQARYWNGLPFPSPGNLPRD